MMHDADGVRAAEPDDAAAADLALDVRGLRGKFPTRRGVLTALSDISLSIAPGEILGVVGDPGAGKSMTGLAVLGLLQPPGRITAGEIHVGGRRIDRLGDRAMEKVRGREIGAIFQDQLTSLNPLFTIGQQLIETICLHLGLRGRAARARAVDLLAEVGIPAPAERVDHQPHQFSGGMRQRVVIALALAAEPKLIIADEPTTALDVSIQAQITALLRCLCDEQGAGVMLVTAADVAVVDEPSLQRRRRAQGDEIADLWGADGCHCVEADRHARRGVPDDERIASNNSRGADQTERCTGREEQALRARHADSPRRLS